MKKKPTPTPTPTPTPAPHQRPREYTPILDELFNRGNCRRISRQAEIITLGGRDFELLPKCTLEGESYWAQCLQKGGLGMLGRRPGEGVGNFLARVEARLRDSGVVYRLMATRLVRLGEPWTAETAGTMAERLTDTTAEFLGLLTAPEDLSALRGVFDRLVLALAEEKVAP